MTSLPAVHQGSEHWPAAKLDPVVTIGNFDGVHRGHQALIAHARDRAGDDGRVAVLTFDPPPRQVLRGTNQLPLQSLQDRIAFLGQAGADDVIVEPFNLEYSTRSAESFALQILQDRLHAKAVVVGWDFRFGRDRGGNADALRRVLGVPVEQVAGVELAKKIVSSTRVRSALAKANLAEVSICLGRPHQVQGRVVHGDARGRSIGIPTANVLVGDTLLPPYGVYAVIAQCAPGSPWLAAVANLGVRPQFGPTAGMLEVHLLDTDPGDLYNTTLRVGFLQKIRQEMRFASVDALVEQIHRDIEIARTLIAESHWAR